MARTTKSPLNLIIEDQQRRAVRSSAVEVITLNRRPGGKALAAGSPGTIQVVLARKGSGVIERVRDAVDGNDDRFKQVISSILAPYRRKKSALSLDALVKLTLRQPVFADLRSNGERLHSGVFVPPGAEAIPLVYPYNGGPLPAKGLELVEYLREGAREGLEAIALRCEPALNRAEAAALKLIPKDQVGRNIGSSAWCDTTWLAVAAVVVMAGTIGLAGAAATAVCLPTLDVHMSEETIKTLGPAASARRLLDMRRTALVKAAAKAKAFG